MFIDSPIKTELNDVVPNAQELMLLKKMLDKVHFASPSDSLASFSLSETTSDSYTAMLSLKSSRYSEVAEVKGSELSKIFADLEQKMMMNLNTWKESRHKKSSDYFSYTEISNP